MIDAAAAASVAALYGDATPVTTEDTTTVLALLEQRTNLSQQRVRAVNLLHARCGICCPAAHPPA